MSFVLCEYVKESRCSKIEINNEEFNVYLIGKN